ATTAACRRGHRRTVHFHTVDARVASDVVRLARNQSRAPAARTPEGHCMKNLTLIVHADTEQALADVLRGLPQVSGFTFTNVEDHGPQDERSTELSARD